MGGDEVVAETLTCRGPHGDSVKMMWIPMKEGRVLCPDLDVALPLGTKYGSYKVGTQ